MNPKLAKILKVLAPILLKKWRERQAAKHRTR